ncbi:MAG: hypothetical protein WCS65_15740 [Verrucomicrobiae bacterium]
MKDWIFDRLKENSTWRGIIILAGLLGAHFQPEQQEAFVGAALAIVALINVFRSQPSVPGGKFNPACEVRKVT